MPVYELRSQPDASVSLGSFEAHDVDEAIALSIIRQERCELDIFSDGVRVACVSVDNIASKPDLESQSAHDRLAAENAVEQAQIAAAILESEGRRAIERLIAGPHMPKREWR